MITGNRRTAVLLCACQGNKSFFNIDFTELAERVRVRFGHRVEVVAIHPRLCESDGERLMAKVIDPQTRVITVGCCVFQQGKMLRDGFERADVQPDEDNWVRVDITGHDTESAFNAIEEALLDPEELVSVGNHAAAD